MARKLKCEPLLDQDAVGHPREKIVTKTLMTAAELQELVDTLQARLVNERKAAMERERGMVCWSSYDEYCGYGLVIG
jgi:hypothetical protein